MAQNSTVSSEPSQGSTEGILLPGGIRTRNKDDSHSVEKPGGITIPVTDEYYNNYYNLYELAVLVAGSREPLA
jgi:hypothetical protein